MQFLGSRDGSSGGGGNGNGGGQASPAATPACPADTSDFDSPAPASVGSSSDDDIPF